jgi:molybdate transport system regulatory protein
MTRLTVRIDFDDDAAFGPGKARLLECVESAGSIRGAAVTMGMSYRRAWMLLQEIENIVGAPVVAGASGGVKGGGTTLTALGRTVMNRYRTIEKRAEEAVRRELNALTALTRRQHRRDKLRTSHGEKK